MRSSEIAGIAKAQRVARAVIHDVAETPLGLEEAYYALLGKKEAEV